MLTPSCVEGDKPTSGSWLSRWWKKEGNGPIKANLGEETAFYYDKELKKWVNKKVFTYDILACVSQN